jgi:ankyrin repeat protein
MYYRCWHVMSSHQNAGKSYRKHLLIWRTGDTFTVGQSDRLDVFGQRAPTLENNPRLNQEWESGTTPPAVKLNSGRARLSKKNGALIHAANEGQVAEVKQRLDDGADVNAADKHGMTALRCAALWGHLEVVKILLDRGADVDASDENRVTPLIGAALQGKVEVVKLLIAKGADVNARSRLGSTALSAAVRADFADVAELLRQHGGEG